MTTDVIRALAQECYNVAKATDRPTRAVAGELVENADEEVVFAMAIEYLVDVVARAQRGAALEVERQSTQRPQRIPRKGTAAREKWMRETEEGRRWAEVEAHDEYLRTQTWTIVSRAIKRYAEEMHVQWTAELLDSSFTLRDGSSVTWGDATVDQHEERKAIFVGNAHVNLEGAARHDLAIQQLRESGRESLRELVGTAA